LDLPSRRPASKISCLHIIWYNCTIGVQERDGQVGWRTRVNKSYYFIGSESVHPRWTQVLVHLSKLRKSRHSLLSHSNSHSRHTPGRLGSRVRGPMDLHGTRPPRIRPQRIGPRIRPHKLGHMYSHGVQLKEFSPIDPTHVRVPCVTPPS